MTRERATAPVRSKKRNARAKQAPTVGTESGKCLAQAFSDIELLVAADVIKAALAEGRKHVDPQALRSVLAKLTVAYNLKKQLGA
jgi:hypothetical protein